MPEQPAPEDPRRRLTRDREAAQRQLVGLQRELDGIVEAAGHANADDEHDPEGATIAFERQHVAALLHLARDRLAAIDEALRRLDEGRYGHCERCGKPIDPARLTARPSAATCLSCAAELR
jgi:RNA polymerase-binding transcription factor